MCLPFKLGARIGKIDVLEDEVYLNDAQNSPWITILFCGS